MDILIHIFLLFSALVIVSCQCPIGWKHFAESCYLFSSYKLSWYLASASCAAHHSTLAMVETKEESDFLRNTSMSLKREFWLDGVDDVVEGLWKWASTDRNITFTDWGPHQPSNGGSRHNEDCLQINPSLHYHWNDGSCVDQSYFICEYTEGDVSIFGK